MDTGFGGEWCRRSDGLNLRQKLRRMCDARLQSLTQILLFLHRHSQLRIKTPDIALQGCNARKEDILQRILRLVVDGGQGLGRRRCRQKAQQERHRKHDDRSKLHIVGRRRCWRCRVSSNIIPEDRGCSRRWREDITMGERGYHDGGSGAVVSGPCGACCRNLRKQKGPFFVRRILLDLAGGGSWRAGGGTAEPPRRNVSAVVEPGTKSLSVLPHHATSFRP